MCNTPTRIAPGEKGRFFAVLLLLLRTTTMLSKRVCFPSSFRLLTLLGFVKGDDDDDACCFVAIERAAVNTVHPERATPKTPLPAFLQLLVVVIV